jgi:hypothetical protein
MVAIATLAIGVGLAGTPAFAGADSDHMSTFFQEACSEMQAQFDGAAASRQGHARYNEAMAMRNKGVAECEYGMADTGSVKLRSALQMIDLNPNF